MFDVMRRLLQPRNRMVSTLPSGGNILHGYISVLAMIEGDPDHAAIRTSLQRIRERNLAQLLGTPQHPGGFVQKTTSYSVPPPCKRANVGQPYRDLHAVKDGVRTI